jgi:hypothetical protein
MVDGSAAVTPTLVALQQGMLRWAAAAAGGHPRLGLIQHSSNRAWGVWLAACSWSWPAHEWGAPTAARMLTHPQRRAPQQLADVTRRNASSFTGCCSAVCNISMPMRLRALGGFLPHMSRAHVGPQLSQRARHLGTQLLGDKPVRHEPSMHFPSSSSKNSDCGSDIASVRSASSHMASPLSEWSQARSATALRQNGSEVPQRGRGWGCSSPPSHCVAPQKQLGRLQGRGRWQGRGPSHLPLQLVRTYCDAAPPRAGLAPGALPASDAAPPPRPLPSTWPSPAPSPGALVAGWAAQVPGMAGETTPPAKGDPHAHHETKMSDREILTQLAGYLWPRGGPSAVSV